MNSILRFGKTKRGDKSSSSSSEDTPDKKRQSKGTVYDRKSSLQVGVSISDIKMSEEDGSSLSNNEILQELRAMRQNQEKLHLALTTQMNDMKRELLGDMDRKLSKIQLNVSSQLNRFDSQLKDLERKVSKFDVVKDKVEAIETQMNAGYIPQGNLAPEAITNPDVNPCDNPEITIIASEVPELPNENCTETAVNIILALGHGVHKAVGSSV